MREGKERRGEGRGEVGAGRGSGGERAAAGEGAEEAAGRERRQVAHRLRQNRLHGRVVAGVEDSLQFGELRGRECPSLQHSLSKEFTRSYPSVYRFSIVGRRSQFHGCLVNVIGEGDSIFSVVFEGIVNAVGFEPNRMIRHPFTTPSELACSFVE
ncbi:hypothetical protein U1Q18_021876 [Sarracenia purpurea var. burkii]